MMGMAILGGWIAWLGVSTGISLWLSRRLRLSWLPWLTIPLLAILPYGDVMVARVVGERWARSVGAYRINEVVEVPGFLDLTQTNTDGMILSDFFDRRPAYQFAEIQYTKAVDISWNPGLKPRPGFYQFRPLDPRSQECNPVGETFFPDVWRAGPDQCVRISRTEVPVSRYSWEGWTALQPGPWAGRLGIRGQCVFAREISTQRILAQACRFVYASILGVFPRLARAFRRFPRQSLPDFRGYPHAKFRLIKLGPARKGGAGTVDGLGRHSAQVNGLMTRTPVVS